MHVKNLTKEFKNLMDFWLNMGLTENRESINSEISINGITNTEANMGSMYLARIIYGASIACKTIKTDKYKILADIAFGKLIGDFKNPKGGFYWAKDKNEKVVHDAENGNMAQAFVLYGLAEYVSLNNKAEAELIQQSKFIIQQLTDIKHGGFTDGFEKNWQLSNEQTKALGTHVHLLEAFSKQFEFNKKVQLIPIIEYLISIIIEKFFDTNEVAFLHRTTPNWKVLPNFNWAGHNAEISWILCKSATLCNNKNLIEKCNTMALTITERVIKIAHDEKNGGYFNAIENNRPSEKIKGWWPQAEVEIALLNAYQISNDKKYLKLAEKQQAYISNNFIHKSGEWYTELNADNSPVLNQPLVFFWKSMYHTVRYYVEVLERLKE